MVNNATINGNLTKGGTGEETNYVGRTTWGAEDGALLCPAGKMVTGIQTRSEGNQGSGDDTGMNQIKLYCK